MRSPFATPAAVSASARRSRGRSRAMTIPVRHTSAGRPGQRRAVWVSMSPKLRTRRDMGEGQAPVGRKMGPDSLWRDRNGPADSRKPS